ncbi:MAG: TetR/AcrR family transcriptional regulator [Methyloligellaceae bacterium]
MEDNKDSEERNYHHGDLKTALVDVARKMLEESGPEAISFREIARQVGVSRTAPYNHFQSKEHLLATVAAGGFQEFLDYNCGVSEGVENPEERIVVLMEGYVEFALKHPQLYRLMFGVGIADWHDYPEVKLKAKAAYEPITQAIVQHYQNNGVNNEEAVETAAVTVWSTFHGFVMLVLDGKLNPSYYSAETTQALAKRLSKWFIAGLDAGFEDLQKT